MMIIPKKLQIVKDNEVLEEVAKELNINIRDVKKTYKIWLDFLDYIANDTDQATISIPNIGQMYVCIAKLRRGLNSEKLKRFKERKLKEIYDYTVDCEYNIHEKSTPIILKYGLSKRNILENIKKNISYDDLKPEFYKKRDIINNQTNIFFKEDKDYEGNEKLKKLFLNE